MRGRTKRYDTIQALLSPETNMARWRGEQRGSLKRTATGWHGKWREYVERDGVVEWRQTGWRKLCNVEDGKARAIEALNERLAIANGPAAVPQGVATLAQFVEVRFRPALRHTALTLMDQRGKRPRLRLAGSVAIFARMSGALISWACWLTTLASTTSKHWIWRIRFIPKRVRTCFCGPPPAWRFLVPDTTDATFAPALCPCGEASDGWPSETGVNTTGKEGVLLILREEALRVYRPLPKS